jgi:hypothetical protein
MNRRDLLKAVVAAPVVVAAAPLIAAEAPADFNTADMTYVARYTHKAVALGFAIDDGVALSSIAHPGSEFTTEQLRRSLDGVFGSPRPDDEDWEWDELSDDSLEEIEIDLPEQVTWPAGHELAPGVEVCIHCREPALVLEDQSPLQPCTGRK